MDEGVVREHAQAHAQAVMDGDNNRAGSDLAQSAMAGVGPVMKAMPNPITSVDIASVQAEGEAVQVTIRYRGAEDAETVVHSRWVDEGGRPKIAELKLG
jgi:hypothetical protein